MPILAVVNQSTATGKTTTAIEIAAHLAAFGAETLLVDADPNGDATAAIGRILTQNLGHVLGGELRLDQCVAPSAVRQLDLVRAPSHTHGDLDQRAADLGPALQTIAGRYGYVVVDCPTLASAITQSVLSVADLAIVPAPAEPESLDDVAAILRALGGTWATTNPRLRVALLITMDRARGRAAESAAQIRRAYPQETLQTSVPFDPGLEAILEGASSLDRHSPGRHAYEQVAMEIASRSAVAAQ